MERASSGVTSAAMLASPSTRMCSISPAVACRFEILAGVVQQAELQALAGHRPFGRLAVAVELIADRGADEVGAVGVEAFLHHQVDVAEVDIAEVDRDLLAVARLGPQLVDVAGHLSTILSPSVWMVNG